VTTAQLAVFADRAQERFLRELIAADSPAGLRGATDADLLPTYGAWVADGRSLGFRTEFELAVFVAGCAHFSGSLWREGSDDIGRLVANTGISAASRTRRLERFLESTAPTT